MTQLKDISSLRLSAFELQAQSDAGDYKIDPNTRNVLPKRMEMEKISNSTIPGSLSGSVREGKPMMLVSEGRGAEPFRLPPAQRRDDGLIRDLYVIENELQEKSIAERALRQSQHELRQLSVQLMTIQEKERQRIAADLHDGIGQSLSLLKLSIESVAQLVVAGENQEAFESLQRMIHKVKDAMEELRRTTSDLRPSMLDDLGIIPTVTWFFREFELACPEKTIEKNFNVTESDIPLQLKATIFRILQEAVNNIVKHAGADSVKVGLNRASAILQFSIEDNGQGFDLAALSARRGSDRGFGLLTMKERAISSGGMFEIKSTPGLGTRIQIAWRLKDGAVDPVDAEIIYARDN